MSGIGNHLRSVGQGMLNDVRALKDNTVKDFKAMPMWQRVLTVTAAAVTLGAIITGLVCGGGIIAAICTGIALGAVAVDAIGEVVARHSKKKEDKSSSQSSGSSPSNEGSIDKSPKELTLNNEV
ncbi:MAG: hypothetical protein LBI69_01670 [Puniceicoccales bacterium]|jgi:hypothetical protein|nr:hypothetical protein [Puniceicoccales bacterium]